MAYFFKDGRLKIGNPDRHADVSDLVSQYDGPVYLYDLDNIELRHGAFQSAFSGLNHSLHYAMKANSHDAVLRKLAQSGAGVDTVSAGEIRLALDAGFKPETIIFSGVGKTVSEIEFALRARIKQINVESPQELRRIADVASRLRLKADIAFRLNPDVSPQTHPYITTGFRENKFGMDESFFPELLEILNLNENSLALRGLTMHIGSQIFDLDCLKDAIEKTLALHNSLQTQGYRLDRLDIGGGLGVHYETGDEKAEFDLIRSYGQMAKEALGDMKVEVLTEPGRILVARSGLLVGEVQYVKRTPAKLFAILNTGMHHLLRPALYGARHRVLPVKLREATELTYDIVGPICESSDFLAKDIQLPEIQAGEWLGIADSGAYGAVMASRYNAHELPIEIAISNGQVL